MIDVIDDNFSKRQYEAHLQDYLSLNQDGHVGGGTIQARLELIRGHLPTGSKIFEIGSGGGEDALALQKAGYVVTASDYSERFVEILKAKRLSALVFDAKHVELPEPCDGLYANAVFVHFSAGELESFLLRLHRSLRKNGIIFFSVIRGEGKERRSVESGLERDFQYYTEDELREILTRTGYLPREAKLVDNRWIQIIAQPT